MAGRRRMGEQNKYENWIMLLVCAIFYLSFCLVFGVYLEPDSEGYIEMATTREPVYPLFLLMFRKMITSEIWMKIVILFQNIFMAAAVWMLALWLKKEFNLPIKWAYATIIFHFCVAMLCQFASGRAAIFTNSILTEGITMSMWLLFLFLLFHAIEDCDFRYVAGALLLCAVMMDTRKQMAIGYIVLFATLMFGWCKKQEYLKKMGIVLGMIVVSVLLALGGNRLYNYQLRGEFAKNTRDMNLVLTTTLYVADREDAELIKEDDVRQLFLEVYDILERKGCNYKYAGDGWKNLEAHYEAHYDLITIDTTSEMFPEYAVKHGFAPGFEAEQEADRMSGVIVKSLLADNLFQYIRIYFASMANGFINTIATRGSFFDVYALIAYVVYIGLMLLCFAHQNTRKAALLAMMVLLAIVVNVGVTAALIFCQPRYMLYNMAMFYTAGLVMCYKLTHN